MKSCIRFILRIYDVFCDEVIIHLITNEKMCDFHLEFFNDPTPTDCISFPLDSPYQTSPPCSVLGEILVCPHAAVVYAKKNHKDPYRETLLYIIHGILHLLGYDDLTPKERMQMRRQERRVLKLLDEKQLSLKNCPQK